VVVARGAGSDRSWSGPVGSGCFGRGAALARLASEPFDVLVVGGGVTGAGAALDAASRGLRTAIVERGDWASGTSSKSSKLVHGGIRYLQQREYRLVFENLAERQHLLRNAPHLVTELPFLIPLFGTGGAVNAAVAKGYSTALWLYDLVGGLRIGKRHRRITRDDALAHFPALRANRVAAAFLYYDARTDDARLTLALVRTAVLDHGAVAANYAGVASLAKDGSGRVTGAVLADGTQVRATSVVNATGVWADDVRALDEGVHPRSIRPAKGIHVTVPAARLPCDIAAVLPVPKDRRSIFVVPWGSETYIGTTDTDYDGPIDDPVATAADIAYLLNAVNAATTAALTGSDVTGAWAGLRPLVRNAMTERTADLSRRHRVDVAPSGLVTVTGGKLTTYRKMAADAVDAVASSRSRTRRLPVRGAVGLAYLRRPGAAARLGVSDAVLAHLVARYGAEAPRVLAPVRNDASLLDPLVPGLPYLRAEAVWAAREEMTVTLDDLLSRRTRALLRDREATADAAPAAASLVAPLLGWGPSDTAAQVAAFQASVARERDGVAR
jgi:glycerol-3-phosphate dehydrogenase